MWPIDVQAIHCRDEAGEPSEADPAQDAALEPRDHCLVDAARALQVALRPAEHDPAALHGRTEDLESELDLWKPTLLRYDIPRHHATLRMLDHPARTAVFTLPYHP